MILLVYRLIVAEKTISLTTPDRLVQLASKIGIASKEIRYAWKHFCLTVLVGFAILMNVEMLSQRLPQTQLSLRYSFFFRCLLPVLLKRF